MTFALVPVKQLAAGKSRLARDLAARTDGGAISREALETLSLAMLEDVIDALLATASVGRVVVVTPDDVVAARALAAGAEALVRDDPGLNPALDAATEELSASDPADSLGSRGSPGSGRADASLVVLGDVAGARAEDLESLFEARRAVDGDAVVLAPSRDGGTAALLRSPPSVITGHFGPDSAKAHREAADRAGVAFRECALPSLAIDLDGAADLDAFVAGHDGDDGHDGGGRRTRALLRELGWGST